MSIVLNMNGESKEVVVSGADPVFDGTALAGAEFEVRARTLMSVEEKRLESRHVKLGRAGRVKVDTDALREERLVLMVQDWRGFTDANGAEIPCNAETKRALARHERALASLLIEAVEQKADEARVLREGELGNS